jgi:hypothetical protein
MRSDRMRSDKIRSDQRRSDRMRSDKIGSERIGSEKIGRHSQAKPRPTSTCSLLADEPRLDSAANSRGGGCSGAGRASSCTSSRAVLFRYNTALHRLHLRLCARTGESRLSPHAFAYILILSHAWHPRREAVQLCKRFGTDSAVHARCCTAVHSALVGMLAWQQRQSQPCAAMRGHAQRALPPSTQRRICQRMGPSGRDSEQCEYSPLTAQMV